MSKALTRRRVVLGIPLAVVVAAVIFCLKFGIGVTQAALLFKSPHARAKLMPYIDGKGFIITLEHPDYGPSSKVLFAELRDKHGATIGFWLPYPDAKKGQKVKDNRLTVVFDTSVLLLTKPTTSPAPSPPPKTLPAPSKSFPTTSLGTGTILVVTTNVTTDTPPTDPIMLDPVDVDPCP
jgi:hypothetical protein